MPILEQGLVLMVTGMAVVFAFLVILIFVTRVLSIVVLKYFPEKPVPAKLAAQAVHAAPLPPASKGREAEIAAAVAAAAAFQRRQQ